MTFLMHNYYILEGGLVPEYGKFTESNQTICPGSFCYVLGKTLFIITASTDPGIEKGRGW